MKKNPALWGFIFALLGVIAAFAIYFLFLKKENFYLVDNPTGKTFYFRLNNGDEKIISGGQYVEVNLKKGLNSIKVYDHNRKLLYDSAFNVNKVRGLLNIAHEDYFVNNQYYGVIQNKDSLLLANGLHYEGKTYLGDIRKINRLYTEDFYYNLNEDYDPVVKNIQKVESRTKIFRKQDFFNYYHEYYKF